MLADSDELRAAGRPSFGLRSAGGEKALLLLLVVGRAHGVAPRIPVTSFPDADRDRGNWRLPPAGDGRHGFCDVVVERDSEMPGAVKPECRGEQYVGVLRCGRVEPSRQLEEVTAQ